jgi:pilus assembly protein Flp/PilA
MPIEGHNPLGQIKEIPMQLAVYVRIVVLPWIRARLNPKSELGASLVEYALLVALIAVVCIVAISFVGDEAQEKFTDIGSAVAG